LGRHRRLGDDDDGAAPLVVWLGLGFGRCFIINQALSLVLVESAHLIGDNALDDCPSTPDR